MVCHLSSLKTGKAGRKGRVPAWEILRAPWNRTCEEEDKAICGGVQKWRSPIYIYLHANPRKMSPPRFFFFAVAVDVERMRHVLAPVSAVLVALREDARSHEKEEKKRNHSGGPTAICFVA
jgi:hypothetical protein